MALFFLTLMSGLVCSTSLSAGELVREPVFQTHFYLEEFGKQHKDVIVLVHGLGDAGAKDWVEVVPMLAKKYHVITFDLPGFGRSDKENLLYSPTKYAQFVKWVVDQYALTRGVRSIILVGHSMGGAVALRYASLYPKTLKKLVLVDAAGILHRSAFAKASAKSVVKSDGFWGGFFSDEMQAVGNWLGDMIVKTERIPLPIDTVLNSKRLRSWFLSGNPNTIAAVALLQENFTVAIETLNVPTEIIWGGKDNVAPVRTGKLLHAKLSAPLYLIQGVGHTPMTAAPIKFNETLVEALSNTSKHKHNRFFQTSKRRGVCHNKNNQVFRGAYQSIEIKGCEHVTLEDVSVQRLFIIRSEVNIYNSVIKSDDIGIVVESSRLTATAVDIYGPTGISTKGSKLDLAGVFMKSQDDLVVSPSRGNSKVVFSVSRGNGKHTRGILHDAFHVTPNSPI